MVPVFRLLANTSFMTTGIIVDTGADNNISHEKIFPEIDIMAFSVK